MKLLLALTAMFAFLAFCSWFSISGGFLGAGDYFTTGFAQAQVSEQQQQDLANPDVLNPFPNEITHTMYNESVLDSQVRYTNGFLQRHEGNIRHTAHRYRSGLVAELKHENTRHQKLWRYSGVNRLTI